MSLGNWNWTTTIFNHTFAKISQIEENEFIEAQEFHDYIRHENQKILEETQTNHPLHRDIEPHEVVQAIRKMQNNRAPGHDGITVEFSK